MGADDEKTPRGRPPPMPRPPTPRPRTSDDRDVHRTKTPPRGVGLTEPPVFVEDDVTGNYSGEDLRRIRGQRRTDRRFERLEEKSDEDRKVLGDLKDEVKDLKGDVKGLTAGVTGLTNEVKILADVVRQEREVDITTRVEMHKGAIREAFEERRSERDDKQDARKVRRWTVAKVVAGVFSAGALGAIVHWILAKLG